MRKKRLSSRRVVLALTVAVAMMVMAVSLASCGGGDSSKSNSTSAKLPPGVDEETVAESTSSTPTGSQPASGSDEEDTEGEQEADTTASTPNTAVDLAGGRFTVIDATRPDSNKSVVSSGGREVAGDYLEIELTVQNVGTDLIDLSDYSFRLTSPGIPADTYSDYYGETGTYGAYVGENLISASLLSYSDLSTVAYVMKKGESVDEVFLFFDLNPEDVARNAAVTKDNTTLVIRKVSGSDYGEQVTVPLAGYPD